MKYYFEISSWNLLESFVTESVSPFSFYSERNFGNNLSRYLNGLKEKLDFLILSTKDFGGDISICFDESLIDKDSLGIIHGLKTVYTYPKTIYFRKGLVQFRFNTVELLNSIIAESQILLEVKCVKKYRDDFYIDFIECKNLKGLSSSQDSFSFEKPSYVRFDNSFNKMKGAIVGYVRGCYTSTDESGQLLQNELRNLKNSLGGLNTQIMMNDTVVDNDCILKDIDRCKRTFLSQYGENNSFDVLTALYNEVRNLAKLRADEILFQKSPARRGEKNKLLEEKTLVENQMSEIERSYNLHSVRMEFEKIKTQERANGERIGKTRLYFKKGTAEYNRKQELKGIIDDFENNNEEYQKLNRRLSEIEYQLNGESVGKYDTTISAVFTRMSDILNDVIKIASSVTNSDGVDVSLISFADRILQVDNVQNDPEIGYLNILLSCILKDNQPQQLSEYYVLQLLEESAKQFKKTSWSSNRFGERILNCLRGFWEYKHQRREQFEIPNDMLVLQSIMSFFVKPLGFEQIERYMLIKKFTRKEYAFMLWGACVGFADMPKTFTNILFDNKELTKHMDNFIINNIKE